MRVQGTEAQQVGVRQLFQAFVGLLLELAVAHDFWCMLLDQVAKVSQ